MSDITFMILKVVVSVAIALVTTFLIPYIKSQTKLMKNQDILDMITVAVKAAEQTLEGGEVKKEDVVKFATKYFNENGIKISDEQLDKLIEAAVYSIKSSKTE